jgi:hypothetical protein
VAVPPLKRSDSRHTVGAVKPDERNLVVLKADLISPTGPVPPGSGASARSVVERLDEAECMELLSTARIGRLIYNSRYGPVATR